MLKIRQLAIELLTQDEGLSQAAYDLLVGFLDTAMSKKVKKEKNGRFRLPKNFKAKEVPVEDQDVHLSYLENIIGQIIPGASFERDDQNQLVIYTDKMRDDDDNIVDFVMRDDDGNIVDNYDDDEE